jgi:hypothetical protein
MLKLLPVLLLALPVAAATPEVFEGGWNDNTKIEWVCPKGTEGEIPFRITAPSGKLYHGVLSCGSSV